MALANTTVWEVRITGDDTNGGGFVAGTGTDWSLQDTAQYSVTNGVTNGTTTVSSATANFGTDVVGNIIYIQGGTGAVAANRYQIISRTSSSAIVLDRNTGLTAGTGVTLKIGGALLSPGLAVFNAVARNTIWIKAGTYTVSSTSNVAGGRLTAAVAGLITGPSQIFGYQTTRGDATGTQPILKASGTGYAILTLSADRYFIRNISFDGNSGTTVSGIAAGGSLSLIENCRFYNCPSGGLTTTANTYATTVLKCYVESCGGTAGIVASRLLYCEAKFCTSAGLGATNNGMIVGCISSSNGTYGFLTNAQSGIVAECTSVGNNTGGYLHNGDSAIIFMNCISYGDGVGFRSTSVPALGMLLNSANILSGSDSFFGVIENGVSVGGNPFANLSSSNYALNTNKTAGLQLVGAGGPASFFGGTKNYRDIGASQHLDLPAISSNQDLRSSIRHR